MTDSDFSPTFTCRANSGDQDKFSDSIKKKKKRENTVIIDGLLA